MEEGYSKLLTEFPSFLSSVSMVFDDRERIIKGLIHAERPSPPRYDPSRAIFIKALQSDFTFDEAILRELATSLNRRNIGGDDVFVYAYGHAEEAPVHSVWIYQFYKGHWAGAWTAPPGYRDEEENAAIEVTPQAEYE
jgi:hypothetical protein